MLEVIRNRVAAEVTDVLMNMNDLAAHWIVSTKSNDEECNGGVINSEWEDGMTPAGKAIRLLDFVMSAKKNARCLNQGGIETHNDNTKY